MTTREPLSEASAALAGGRWAEARDAFDVALADVETAAGCFGLAAALWWLGESDACLDRCRRAYVLFRRSGDLAGAAQCAVWLAITYKSNFDNFTAANGWIGRAGRLLRQLEPGPLHGWVWVAQGYRMADLDAAEDLTSRALDLAWSTGDADLELAAMAQLGLIRVSQGETAAGFALIDEAMAAALAGERSTLDTVVYTCCDMLNACELAGDLERAAQWCKAADDFVATYGCPFLYAECRIYYGSVLTAKGRWEDAEQELAAGLRSTHGACPALHTKALTRLAALRIRQGRLEEAEQLLVDLGQGFEGEAEEALCLAALLLARGDASGSSARLEQRLHRLEKHRWHLASALDLLVDAHLTTGDLDRATAAAHRLEDIASCVPLDRVAAAAAAALGRVARAAGNPEVAVTRLGAALEEWSRLEMPFEQAKTRFELGQALAASQPDAAVDQARRALTSFETLGAGLDADRVAAFLRSLGLSPRTGAKGVGVLTLREQQVLRLLESGLSNPEIGARLHISRKTASHHVSSILTKLNLRNRSEAAAYAAQMAVTTAGTPRATSVRR